MFFFALVNLGDRCRNHHLKTVLEANSRTAAGIFASFGDQRTQQA